MSTQKSLTATQVWTVAKWEFMHFFKLKQEIISKLIMLAVGVVIYIFVMNNQQLEQSYTIATNQTFSLGLEQTSDTGTERGDLTTPFNFVQVANIDKVIDGLGDDSEFDAVLKFDAGTITLISVEKETWQTQLTMQVTSKLQQEKFNQLQLTDVQKQGLSKQIIVEQQILDDVIKNQADKSPSLTAFGVLILLFIGMFGMFGQLFVSITGEKQNRVTEQLMATMTPQTWIDGKLTGQILLAIKTMIGTLLSIVLSMLFFTVVIKQQSLDLNFVNWSLLPWFFAFAISGLAISAAFMAAIAAAIDDPNHSGKSGLMMLPVAPIVIAYFLMDAPNSLLTIIMSYLPVTAFAAMPVRMSLVDLPVWEPILSLIISVACFYYLRVFAARVFKMGMNMYGKEPSFKEMFKAIL